LDKYQGFNQEIFLEVIKIIKKYLRANFKKGCVCPACGLWIKEYPYTFHSGMAKALILIHQGFNEKNLSKDDWLHVENYLAEKREKIKGYHGKLKHWGILKQKPNDDSKKKYSGYWQITEFGLLFLSGDVKVSKVAHLFNDKCQSFSGKLVG